MSSKFINPIQFFTPNDTVVVMSFEPSYDEKSAPVVDDADVVKMLFENPIGIVLLRRECFGYVGYLACAIIEY